MTDEPSRMTPCPRCGEPVPPAAKLCPHCGADGDRVWPPPVVAGPPEEAPARARLLTGRKGVDEFLGWWLAVAVYYVLGQALLFVRYVRLFEVASFPPSSPGSAPVNSQDIGLWLAFGVVALGATGGAYLTLHRLLPWVGRGFGQGLVLAVGMTLTLVTGLKLFP
jgi:hypothetical protein